MNYYILRHTIIKKKLCKIEILHSLKTRIAISMVTVDAISAVDFTKDGWVDGALGHKFMFIFFLFYSHQTTVKLNTLLDF